LTVCVVTGVARAADEPPRLTEDERNTIAVFREASRGVVHVESRATTESRFEKGVIEAGAGSGFLIDAEGLDGYDDGPERHRVAPGVEGMAPEVAKIEIVPLK
jgi:hypothetical protein